MDCIFCRIVEGSVPSYKIFEDETVLAFLDIAPVNYGHVLVIPKAHFRNLEEVDHETLHRVVSAVKKVGEAVKASLGVPGYNVCENNDPAAGQVVPHLHFHIIPRLPNDGLEPWPQGKYGDGEAEETAMKIRGSVC